jgi:hypothetical protein
VSLVAGTRAERIEDMWPHEEHLGYYCPVTIDGERFWRCVTPNGHAGNLSAHDVVEHDDGSITVSPSILVSDHTGELWHGYLERGVWRSA